jgi:hypothetical protein
MLIYFSEIIKDYPNHTKEFGKIFNDSFTLKTNSILGTLREPTRNEYDLILTNPPYVTSGSSNLKEEINKDEELKKYYKVNGIGVEGLFMEWIIRALKPNGKAFVVVPDGIFNRQNDKNLRAFIKEECFIDGIISLPLNTFFTTNKKTYILCLTKKNSNKDIQKDPIFTYLVSEIGESRDINRFDIEENDLDEAVTLFNFFKGNKKSFRKFNQDPRCKIIDFKILNENIDSWITDTFWSKEEKISLGILEDKEKIQFENFPIMLDDISNTILSFKDELVDLTEKKKSIINKKQVLISEILESPPTNSGLKKSDVNLIKTSQFNIPVYSASMNENSIFGWCSKSSKWKQYKNVLTWNKDGSAGLVFYRKHKFIPYEKVKILKIKTQYKDFLLYEYLRSIIEQRLIEEDYSFNFKCSMDRVLKLSVEIPIDNKGIFCLRIQNTIIRKVNLIKELQAKIKIFIQYIKNINVEIKNNCKIEKKVKINEILDTKKGLSKYTKTYGQEHKGDYPVYSASNNAPLTYIDTFDYDGKYLTWATNGFAGYIKVMDEKFSANGDRGILIPKVDNIDLDYMKFIIEPILRELAKGRKGDKGKDEFTKVYPSMVEDVTIAVPILKNGNLDLNTQKEIAEKYLKIEQIKSSIQNELEKISKISIEY